MIPLRRALSITKEPEPAPEKVPIPSPPEPVKEEMPVYLDKAGAAKLLGVTIRCIDSWMAKRIIPYWRIGRTIRFHAKELEEHVRNKCRIGR